MVNRPQRSHLIILVAILAAAAYITAFFPKQDFAVYYAAGQSLLSGRSDLYAPDFANAGVMDYRYPPVFVLLFLPFAALPFTVAAYLWAVFGLSAIVCAFQEVARTSGEFLKTNRLKIAIIVSAILTAKYLLISLKYQNVHLLVVAAIFISFCLLLKNKIMPAALLMALAIAIKIFPVVLLPYFAIKRQWRFLGMTAGLVMLFFLVPAYYFGIDKNIDLHQQWFGKVVNESDSYELNGPPNLSVPGQTIRYMTTVPYEQRVLDRSYANVNFVEVAPETAKRIGNILAGIIAIISFAIVFLLNRNNIDGLMSDRRTISEFGFMICMMLLVGPRANIIYFTAMFIPYILLMTAFLQHRTLLSWMALVITALVTIVLPLVPGAKAQRLLLVLGIDTIAALAVWVMLGWLLLKTPNEPDEVQRHLP